VGTTVPVVGTTVAVVRTLRAWYTRAARLIKVAIEDDDPPDQAQLRELPGPDL
jgi:hypothetical protein